MFPCCRLIRSDMSYILEALKKVDRERGMGGVPGLATPHEVRRPQIRSNRWLWIIVAMLSVNAVLVFVLLSDRDKEDANSPVPAQVAAEREPVPTTEPPVQAVQPVSEVAAGIEPDPEKQVLPESRPEQSRGELVMLPEPAYPQNPEPAMPMEDTADIGIADMTTAQDHSPLQSWFELPQDIRNNIDLPRLDVHVYSEDPRKRFIMVDLQKFREGERLPSGLVVEEILPDGVVLSYQGERFRVDK